jgi:alpha-ketoglutarate-dependent 2,4-dichlorophenoxyacetate dioxygenase
MTAISVTRLAPSLGARFEGVDLTRAVPPAVFAEIRAAFEEHSVLVFHGQALDDDAQVAFSKNFGPLEVTLSANPAAGTPFARQSNLDIRTGDVIPPDDRRMTYQQANMLWHSDSSFKRVPALCSLLSGRVVPPEGGATEFTSTRAAYATLPDAVRASLEDLVVVHDFAWSRDQISPGFFTVEEKAQYPPVRHRLVRTNPINGRRSLLIGAHASQIEGMSVERGRALLKELLEHAARPEFRYRHEWREGDLVIWDNRAVLHRATPYDTVRHRRLMQRTTVSGDGREETLACAS